MGSTVFPSWTTFLDKTVVALVGYSGEPIRREIRGRKDSRKKREDTFSYNLFNMSFKSNYYVLSLLFRICPCRCCYIFAFYFFGDFTKARSSFHRQYCERFSFRIVKSNSSNIPLLKTCTISNEIYTIYTIAQDVTVQIATFTNKNEWKVDEVL